MLLLAGGFWRMRDPQIIPDRAALSAGFDNPRIRGAVGLWLAVGSTARLRAGREMASTGEDAVLACCTLGLLSMGAGSALFAD